MDAALRRCVWYVPGQRKASSAALASQCRASSQKRLLTEIVTYDFVFHEFAELIKKIAQKSKIYQIVHFICSTFTWKGL